MYMIQLYLLEWYQENDYEYSQFYNRGKRGRPKINMVTWKW